MYYRLHNSSIIFIFDDTETKHLFPVQNIRTHPGSIRPIGTWRDGITFRPGNASNNRQNAPITYFPLKPMEYLGDPRYGIVVPGDIIKAQNFIKHDNFIDQAQVYTKLNEFDSSIFIRPQHVVTSSQGSAKATVIAEVTRKHSGIVENSFTKAIFPPRKQELVGTSLIKPVPVAESVFGSAFVKALETNKSSSLSKLVEVENVLTQPVESIVVETVEPIKETIETETMEIQPPIVTKQEVKIDPVSDRKKENDSSVDISTMNEEEQTLYIQMLIAEINRYKSEHPEVIAKIENDGKTLVFSQPIKRRVVVSS